MNTYDAMHAAADHIAAHPESYEFMQGSVPPEGSSFTACMLARMGQFLGYAPCTPCEKVCHEQLLIPTTYFYHLIDHLVGDDGARCGNRNEAQKMSRAMHAYAERYLEPRTGIPKCVRELFHVEREEA